MVDKTQVNILLVENVDDIAGSFLHELEIPSFQAKIFRAKNIKEAIRIVLEKPIDGIIFQYQVNDGNAIEFLEGISLISARMIPTIVMASETEEKMGMQVFRKGARDFLIKDKQGNYLKRLPMTLERVLKEEIRYRENTRLKKNSEAVLATVSDGMLGVNLDGVITFANPAAALYLNQPLESLIGKKIDAYAEHIDITFAQSLSQGMHQIQISNQLAVIGQYMLTLAHNQQSCMVEISLTPIFNELMHLEGYVLSFRDISETKYLSEEVRHMSIEDDLTGLFNRKAFIHRLEHVISYCNRYHTKCAVLFIDLDGFKTINDALGHLSGDEILLKVVDRIQTVIRETDILARVGGDEFMVMLTHVNHPNDAARVAIKINRALLPSIELNGQKYYLTASIGIALYPNDSSDARKLVQYADFAMSMVKKSGKNNYQYYKPDLNLEADRMMRLSNDLRVAIQSNQLDLYFHPQVSATTGELIGLEALVRWHHPELGLIPPKQFIPIAEEMGFIGNIGQWVLQKTCESCLLWQQIGLENFTLSVNLSVNELQREDFLDDLVKCFTVFHIHPNRFQFEITESVFAHDVGDVMHKLRQLKSMGFQIAMDDFGTGYSCLSYLKDFPIDVIKIDRSFVQSLSYHDNERHKAIIAAIIDLAKRLDMATLAEGVETEAQAEYLTSLGCESLQGFLFAKPMTFSETTEYIREKIQEGGQMYLGKKLH
ncbi:MAG: hypothetical protein BGO43_03075 [Gammaproteobacteria bacterium 39-13]|nr:EAL domain-containing protein [Gammaproteobacteria bacterium]OJV86986.1 MAG: hypothetical protein BGO43_03075 [Gammaproteobacteria bacterium 39-13]